ncbi:MAG: hypothetical protein ACK4OE_23990 [Acidovorax sp.]|uniref:hypothetical protein n=1 Tax=Acidovorax sp. TaxID=1872122 RepID=UPI003919E12F
MYRLETTADFVFVIILSLTLGTLGTLMLVFPLERLPADRQSYQAVSGVLREVKDESPRRATSIVFALEDKATRFASTFPPTREDAKTWVVGQTTLQFFVQKQAAAGLQPVPVYGIKVDSRQLKSLEQDIEFHNAAVNPWGGLMALATGVLGILVIVVRWHQKRVA